MGNQSDMDSLERPGMFKEVKVVLVGPSKCGKTALVQRFVTDSFNNAYTPTGFEKYSTNSKLGEYSIQYSLWDTSGSGAYDSIRPLAYQDANVFLLCFNVGDPESLDHAINKWYSEIKSHNANTPIILCGCRSDSRNDVETITYLAKAHKMPITPEQAKKACMHISAAGYVETSALYSNIVVPQAFELAAKAALGILNEKPLAKKMKKITHNSTDSIKHKTDIKKELKGRAKNCSIM